jgi:TrkA domain protein
MRIDRMTVPGNGVLHQIVTRDGERFSLLVDADHNRHLFTYGAGDLDDDPDMPAETIVLEPDEADEVAEILHSRPELIGERGP